MMKYAKLNNTIQMNFHRPKSFLGIKQRHTDTANSSPKNQVVKNFIQALRVKALSKING